MIIKIDNRETSRVCMATKYYMSKYKIIIEQLEIGDFIFKENKKEVVFEYKTLTDLIWSIHDGRLYKQAIKQKNNFKNHYIIIEWNKEQKNKTLKQLKKMGITITENDIYESIARLNKFTNVIISPKKESSFNIMENYAKIALEDDIFENKTPEKTNNIAVNFLTLIKGVNKPTAHKICKKLKLKTVEDLYKISTTDLQKVNGIGPIISQKIITSLVTSKS